MREPVKTSLLEILDARGDAIVRASAEWVFREGLDLQGKRPFEETLRLCTAAFAAYKAYVRTGDYQPLATFIQHVVEYRGDMGFRLSTMQRGMFAFKIALAPILDAEVADLELRLEMTREIDAIYNLVLFDFSDRYQEKTTQRLTELASRAEAASQAKSEFLARMSHEIRTPLNAILGFSQLMSAARLQSAPIEELEEYLTMIRESARLVGDLLDNILDLARIEAGRMAIDEREIDLERLVEGVVEISRAQAIEKAVHFDYAIDPALPRYIRCDDRKLNQILMNLTVNAIKFTPENRSVEVRMARIDVSPPKLSIRVRDEGIGIPEPMQKIIFDPFEQGDVAMRSHRGSGLGLAITRRLVELLGGEISLESAPGLGSTFQVELPLFEASAIVDARSELEWEYAPRFDGKVVVVIDDDHASLRLLAVLLEDLGVRAFEAPTGSAGVDLVARVDPHLVLLDVHLPDLDGIKVVRAIRSTPGRETTPITMVSGDALAGTKAAAKEAGADDYLTKPVQLKELLAILEKHLGDRALPD